MVLRQRLVDLVVEVRVVRRVVRVALRGDGAFASATIRSTASGRMNPSSLTAPSRATPRGTARWASRGRRAGSARGRRRRRSRALAYGRCGTGAGATASFRARTTRARSPSSTGTSPPSSRRASSTRPCDAHRAEPEVREEVRREDRAVDEEPLVRRLALPVAVRERLQRLRPAVLRVADRGEEERLHHPRRVRVHDVRAGDEHGIRRGRPGRQLGRAREEPGRPVLHRAEQPPVAVVVDRAPRPPLLLGLLDPAALVDGARRATATRCTRGRRTARSRGSRR